MSRKSQLQVRYLSNDNQNNKDLLISEKFSSKTSTNLGRIKEENRENGGSQATFQEELKDPHNNTPRGEDNRIKRKYLEERRIQESEEERKDLKDNMFVHYGTENIQHIAKTSKLLTKDLFIKLQPGEKEKQKTKGQVTDFFR